MKAPQQVRFPAALLASLVLIAAVGPRTIQVEPTATDVFTRVEEDARRHQTNHRPSSGKISAVSVLGSPSPVAWKQKTDRALDPATPLQAQGERSHLQDPLDGIT